MHTLGLLAAVSFAMLLAGLVVFGRLTKGFYEHL